MVEGGEIGGVSSRGAWQWVGGGWVETEGDGSDAFITMISSGCWVLRPSGI